MGMGTAEEDGERLQLKDLVLWDRRGYKDSLERLAIVRLA